MIISRTPLRISFTGGGSDLPSFYTKNEAAVISTTIDKYIYIAVEKQFDKRIIISYSKTEIVKDIKEIKNNLVREALNLVGIKNGIHITSISDIPSEGTGMGSSSAYTVGLLNALYAFKGIRASKEKLAREASIIEIDILNKPIGKQDQYITSFGDLSIIKFKSNHSVNVNKIQLSIRKRIELEENLILFYTGLTRSADAILSKQNFNINKNKNIEKNLIKMVTLTNKLKKDLDKNNINSFGETLHKNWELKKTLTDSISNNRIDKWYETAFKNGALGGKLLGAGGGGFMLFYASPTNHKKIIIALNELTPLPFKFESEGTKIIYSSK